MKTLRQSSVSISLPGAKATAFASNARRRTGACSTEASELARRGMSVPKAARRGCRSSRGVMCSAAVGGAPNPKKVVLAYSGGLDTSIILKWLQNTYGCEGKRGRTSCSRN